MSEYNLDTCPECDGDLEPVNSFDEREQDDVGPLQGNLLGCKHCDHETTVAILHYPDRKYIGIWEAHDESCECGNDASYGIERVDGDPLYQCGMCVYDLYQHVYIDSVRLL